MITINNSNIVKKKIEETLEKFNKLSLYVNQWVDEKIKSNKLKGGAPGINYLAFMPVDKNADNLEIPSSEDCGGDDITADDCTSGLAMNGIFTNHIYKQDFSGTKSEEEFTNEIYFTTNTAGHNLSNTDFKFTNTNFNIKLKKLINGTPPQLDVIGMVPLDFPLNTDKFAATTPNVKISTASKRIMGVNSSFDAIENFYGIPFFVSNTSFSMIKIDGNDDSKMVFLNNLPLIETTNTYYPPYTMTFVCIFPWFVDAETPGIPNTKLDYNYGFTSKQIFSVSQGY
jgi:hypothetical protein